MSEPRKIVLILGNGFDLDLGLETSYKNFWESEFCPKDYPAPLIHHLNERWPKNLNGVKWYDLENELSAYYHKAYSLGIKNDIVSLQERSFLLNLPEERFIRGHYKQNESVIASLIQKGLIIADSSFGVYCTVPHLKDLQEYHIQRDRKALQLIKERLCEYLRIAQQKEPKQGSIAGKVLSAVGFDHHNGDFVNIYTFNYTQIHSNGWSFPSDHIHYIHGNCQSGKIIVGTGDSLDINEGYDFLQKSFDTNFAPPALVKDLAEADHVIIFGHSIGENDRQYFKAFFKHQTDYSQAKRKDITIFTRDESSEIEIKRALQRMTDGELSTLFGLNDFRIIHTAAPDKDYKKLEAFLLDHHFNQEQANWSLREF